MSSMNFDRGHWFH